MEILYGSTYIKKRVKGSSSDNKPLRTLYADLFKKMGLLPDTIMKQNPFVLFRMLDDLDDTAERQDEIPENLKFFYGQ